MSCALLAHDAIAAITVFTWTGAGGQDNGWRNGANWAGGVNPIDGMATTDEILLFPAGAANFISSANYFDDSNEYNKIVFTAGGYTITSGGFRVLAVTVILNAAGTNTLDGSSPMGKGSIISAQSGTTLFVKSPFNLGGSCRFPPCTGSQAAPPGTMLSFNDPISDPNTGASSDGLGTIMQGPIEDSIGTATVRVIGGVVRFGNPDVEGLCVCANSYPGVTTVLGGILEFRKSEGDPILGSSVGTAIKGPLVVGTGGSAPASVRYLANTQIADLSDVTVGWNGRFDLNGFIDTIHALTLHSGPSTGASVTTGAGTLTILGNPSVVADSGGANGASIAGNLNLGGTARTFTIADGTAAVDLNVSAIIRGSGSEGLIKNGPGTLRLGAANTYIGTTTINAGTLLVDGSIGGVSLSAGTLGGAGTIGSIAATGGTIAPGASPGILHTGNLASNAGTTFSMELNGSSGGQYDQLAVTGTVSLGNATLSPQLGFTPTIGTVFTIVDNDGADPISGIFAGLPEGGVLVVRGTPLRISYAGGTGNDVTLAAIGVGEIPTLSSMALSMLFLALGMAGVWLSSRS